MADISQVGHNLTQKNTVAVYLSLVLLWEWHFRVCPGQYSITVLRGGGREEVRVLVTSKVISGLYCGRLGRINASRLQ